MYELKYQTDPTNNANNYATYTNGDSHNFLTEFDISNVENNTFVNFKVQTDDQSFLSGL